jgi:hypothetical protein
MLRRCFGYSGRDSFTKLVIVNTQIMRPEFLLSFNAMRPRFNERDSYFSIRQRGNLMIEWVKRNVKPDDPTRYVYDFANKKTFSIFQDKFINFTELTANEWSNSSSFDSTSRSTKMEPLSEGKF